MLSYVSPSDLKLVIIKAKIYRGTLTEINEVILGTTTASAVQRYGFRKIIFCKRKSNYVCANIRNELSPTMLNVAEGNPYL